MCEDLVNTRISANDCRHCILTGTLVIQLDLDREMRFQLRWKACPDILISARVHSFSLKTGDVPARPFFI